MSEKEEYLKRIEELLATYGGEIDIDLYVLKYLSIEELENIEHLILKKQSDVIEDNSEWLKQFKKID